MVEYKGQQAGNPEEEKKRQVGQMWEAKAPEHLAFVWATKEDWQEKIRAAIERLMQPAKTTT
ncbi:MAG: hypothetical protein RH917_10505 [Lacipirellulaceae bacterium]